MVFRQPDRALSAPREAELAALRQREATRQLAEEARFRAALRRPRTLRGLSRFIVILLLALAGLIAGSFLGHHAWEGRWFGQERGDMVGGLNLAFDELLGGAGGLFVFIGAGLLLTRKNVDRPSARS